MGLHYQPGNALDLELCQAVVVALPHAVSLVRWEGKACSVLTSVSQRPKTRGASKSKLVLPGPERSPSASLRGHTLHKSFLCLLQLAWVPEAAARVPAWRPLMTLPLDFLSS